MVKIEKGCRYFPYIAKIKEMVNEFNSSLTNQAGDYLLFQLFNNRYSFSVERASKAVILLDGLWRTQLFRHDEDFDRICESITVNSGKLVRTLNRFKPNDLKDDPDKVCQIAEEVFPIVLGRRNQRQNYSFTSKFFHWCCRNHFPIVDSNARKAINRFQKKHKHIKTIVPKVVTSNEYIDDYKRWIYFYSDLLNSLSSRQVHTLLETDAEDLSPALYVPNTILRILDKAFYLAGNGRICLAQKIGVRALHKVREGVRTSQNT